MGLDSFKTNSSSSSSKDSSNSDKLDVSGVNTSRSNRDPHFTAVMDTELDNVTTHLGINAFSRSSRFKTEKIIKIIYSEDEYDTLDKLSSKYHGKSLPDLFKSDHSLAKDFVERMSPSGNKDRSSTCPVCNNEVNIESDEYTIVDNTPVHAGHQIIDVVESMGIEGYE